MNAATEPAHRSLVALAILLDFDVPVAVDTVICMSSNRSAELCCSCRVRPSESPVMFVYQDWACGLLALKVLYRMASAEGGLSPGLARWRQRVQHVHQIGITRVTFSVAFREVLGPLMKSLAYLLAVPYVLARGIVPLCDISSEGMETLYVFAFTIEGVLMACYCGGRHVCKKLQRLHNSIRDDRYLIGRQLNNC